MKQSLKSVGRVFLPALLILALLVAATGCTFLREAVPIVPAAIRAFLNAVDDQVDDLHNSGWLPRRLYAEYLELRDRAMEDWESFKADLLDYVERLLRGETTPPAADWPSAEPKIADTDQILAAAEEAAAEGYLTDGELAALRAAAR